MKNAVIKYKELMLRSLALGAAVLVGFGGAPPSFAVPAEEIDVTINGKLKIVQIDNEPDAAEPGALMYLLEDDQTHKTLTLRFANKAPRHLRSGMTVTARGKSKGQELFLAADGENQPSLAISSSPTTVVAGEQKTLVMVANLADASVPCSVDSVRDLMFNGPTSSVNGLYRETSYGAVSFSGQVVGPYNLTYQGSSCNCICLPRWMPHEFWLF